MSNQSTPLAVRPVRAFADNYIWLIEPPRLPDQVVAVDPGDAAPVIAELQRSGASLAAILLTHHHADHIGGVSELLELGPVPVIGPDDTRIPQRTRTVRDGERCDLPDLGLGFDILEVPGHTLEPHRLLGPRRAVLRRHAFQRGLRSHVRGYATANECFVEPAARLAAGHRRCTAVTSTPRRTCDSH